MIDTLIKSLRCSALTYNESECECSECPYRLLEEVNEGIPVPYDIEINGKKYWESCDCDKIAIDAADMLERMKEREQNESKGIPSTN